jgi:hypothetical protein
MEGTSGAADLGLLRGRAGDAALGGIAGEVGVSLRLRWHGFPSVTGGMGVSPISNAAMSRQEVSERIGLGRSSCARMPPGGTLREVPKGTCWRRKPSAPGP